jgi:transcriptional regulator NrdR family protein
VDPFAFVLIAGLVALIIWLAVLGRSGGRSTLEQIGMSSAREISERRAALDAEDLEQMVAAHNRRRVARGEEEISSADLEMQLMSEINSQRKKDAETAASAREKRLADRELDELLEATNARRRARGLPERTREEVQREFGGE